MTNGKVATTVASFACHAMVAFFLEVGVVDNIQIATKEAEGMDTQAMVIKVETLVVLELGLTSLTVTVAQRKI